MKETKDIHCVLNFDGSSFILEKVSNSVVQIKHQRDVSNEKKNIPVGTSEKSNLNSILNNNNKLKRKSIGSSGSTPEGGSSKKKILTSTIPNSTVSDKSRTFVPNVLPSSPSSTTSSPHQFKDDLKILLQLPPPPSSPPSLKQNLSGTTINSSKKSTQPLENSQKSQSDNSKPLIVMGLNGKPLDLSAFAASGTSSDDDDEDGNDVHENLAGEY